MTAHNSFAIALGIVFLAWNISQSDTPATAPGGGKPVMAEKPEKTKPAEQLTGELGDMAKTLEFSDELKAKLLETVKTGKAAQEAWEKENDPKAKEIREQIDKLKQELKTIDDAKNAMLLDQKKQIASLISPEQQQAWQKHRLRLQMLGQCRQMSLTDEQKGKIESLCDDAAKEIAAMTPEQKPQNEWKVLSKLYRDFQTVVTAEQKAIVTSESMYGKARYAFKAAGLTPEQDAKLKELSKGAAKEYVQIQEQLTKAESDARALGEKRREAYDAFVKGAAELVLTDEQRAKLAAPASQPAGKSDKQSSGTKIRQKADKPAGDKVGFANKQLRNNRK